MNLFAKALKILMYFCAVKFRFKNAEQKNSIILIVCLLLLLLVGGGLLGVIHHKVDRLKKRILIDFADENMFLVKKQLELLQQDLYLSEKKILEQPTFDPKESGDSLLVIIPVGQPDYMSHRMLTLLRTRTINHRLYHIYMDIERLNAYFAKLNFGRRAYFEIYDDRGICVYSPDNRKWGKRNTAAVSKQGQIVQSDFLQLDVMVNSYPCNILFVGGEIKVYVLLLSIEEEIQELLTYSILLGVGLMLVAMVLIYFNVMERRKIQQLKLLALKQENEYTQMRLVQLRQQINPHFLFNTFGSLQYLIGKDDELAKSFIGKMTKVYRKMLRTDEAEWSTLREELELAKAYFFLQQVRFGAALQDMDINIPRELLEQKIPRLGLQMLIENAIKHTRISKENPLTIRLIYIPETNLLEVSNNWQPRQGAELEGEGYGLNYLSSIYSYYAMAGFHFGIASGQFIVRLPLA
ncbi:sensor histidine kinase [Sphingobacterium sp. UME9]|uniref:sensor histidine kinase n=1 Tax=Sphingobacterium sp. UME9 TaxID=1862316 RepID=UPI0016043E4B|nr:histidine kinase [Sphingobacterium sp. UME9]MBB1645275.1 hypothetical protein [Sphingobacterium sp. UME9]